MSAYQQAQQPDNLPLLTDSQRSWCQIIVTNAETQKAVLAAVITSLTKKVESPQQDVRQHKVELPGGYSGRSYDFNHITPFLQEYFPRYAMAESGWLTRSLEQVHPFTVDFPGKIRNAAVKQAFLEILNDVESNNADAFQYLVVILALLIEHQVAQSVVMPAFRDSSEYTILTVVDLLEKHFFERYKSAGASRLPVVALYTLYTLMMDHPRYSQKQLLPLKSHTTSDTTSASLGDIEVTELDGTFLRLWKSSIKGPLHLHWYG